MGVDLALVDAVGQADLVRSGQLSASEVVEAAIDRVEETNPQLNAIVTRLYDKARQEASTTDPTLPLAGVPYVLKDHLSGSAGDPMSEGMRLLKDLCWAPDRDSHYVTKMRAAGCVLIGKSNLPELALRPTTESEAWGPCRNPWDVSRSTGGSSGGSAAAVAAGLVPVAHATDAGGSIRIPSSLNGAVGLKPSRGRVSQGPDVGDAWANGSWYLGAITTTVRDTAAVLDAVQGYMPGDPCVAPPPLRPYGCEVGAPPGRLRIGFMSRSCEGYPDLDPAVRDGVLATALLLEELGHDVDEAHPEVLDHQAERGLDSFMAIAGSGVGWLLDRWAAATGVTIKQSDVEPTTWAMMQLGESVSGRQFIAAVERTHGFARALARWWDDFDLLLTPTVAVPAFELGWCNDPSGDPMQSVLRAAGVTGGFTVPFNISGQPAISLPLHQCPGGLPAGMQFAAAYAREDLLIRLAAQLEEARPWTSMRPPVHASVADPEVVL